MQFTRTNQGAALVCATAAAGLVLLGSASVFMLSVLLLVSAALVQASAVIWQREGHAGLGACVCVGRPSGRLRVKRAAIRPARMRAKAERVAAAQLDSRFSAGWR